MTLPWGLFGVPSSAAAHWPGLERAPAALRAAGLVEGLRAASVPITDFGDASEVVWQAARRDGQPNNVAAVTALLEKTRAQIEDIIRSGHRPFIVGGECTLTIAALGAIVAQGEDVGLIYVDGGQDLMIPAEHPDEPILDGMGVAHLLDLPGVVDEIAAIGPRRPLLTPRDIAFFGYSDDEEDIAGRVPSARFPAGDVALAPEACAAAAVQSLETDHFLVHVDVDVLDYLQTPAADIPAYGRGLSIDELARSLRVFLADRRCAGLVLVEYNPDHDPGGIAAAEIVQAVVASMPHDG